MPSPAQAWRANKTFDRGLGPSFQPFLLFSGRYVGAVEEEESSPEQ
jgi:hypothetical protein